MGIKRNLRQNWHFNNIVSTEPQVQMFCFLSPSISFIIVLCLLLYVSFIYLNKLIHRSISEIIFLVSAKVKKFAQNVTYQASIYNYWLSTSIVKPLIIIISAIYKIKIFSKYVINTIYQFGLSENTRILNVQVNYSKLNTLLEDIWNVIVASLFRGRIH